MRVVLAVMLALLPVGCCGTLSREKAFHDGVKQYAVSSGLLDEYTQYVDSDPRWIVQPTDDSATKERKERTKHIRKSTATEFRRLIDEEGKALDKED